MIKEKIENIKNRSKSITQHHHYKQLLILGIPIIIGQLGTIVLGFADTLMIGHHSTEELAAAGLVNNVFGLVLLFYLGFSYGLTPVVGKLFGKGRHDEIGVKVKNSIAANMLICLILMTLMTILYFNLSRIGQPTELLELIRPYFIVNLISMPFVGVFNTLKQLFDGIGRTKVSMWVMVAANGLNVLFNWFLIYGACGFPELGLLGAGISTMGSRVVMTLVLAGIFMYKGDFKTYRTNMFAGHVNRTDFAEMNRLGLPVAMQLGMETAAFSLSCVMVGWLGTLPLAAHQVTITISQLFYLILFGMATAISIRISHFAGQNDIEGIKANSRDGFRLVLFCSLLLSIPTLIFRNQLGALFSSNVEVQQTVGMLVIVLIIYQFGDGMQYTFSNALRGISCVKPLVPCAFIAYFLVSLPLGYVLGFIANLGILGIWLAFPFGLTLAGVLYWQRFRKELKKMEGRK